MASTTAPTTAAQQVTAPAPAAVAAPITTAAVRQTINVLSPLVKRATAQLVAANIASNQRSEHNRTIITAPPRAAVGRDIAISSATTRFRVPVLPNGTSDTVRKNFALRLASCLVANNAINDRRTATVILALFHILYEDNTGRSQGKEWTPRELTAQEVTAITSFDADIRNYPLVDDPAFAQKETALQRRHSIAELPDVGDVAREFVAGPLDWLMFHGYAGLLLFAMHKDAASSGEESLRETRPRALRNKYRKSEEEYPLWSDEGIPSKFGFVACTAAWKLIPMTREELMRTFAKISTSPSLADQEALFLAVRLMAWTDLAHIPIITLALNMFPLLQFSPLLRGGFAAYNAGIAQMIDAMPYLREEDGSYARDTSGSLIRDTTTLPYVKAMYGDKKSFAQRNTMELLICVSKKILIPSVPSLEKYAEPAGYGGLVNTVLDWHQDLVAKVAEAELN